MRGGFSKIGRKCVAGQIFKNWSKMRCGADFQRMVKNAVRGGADFQIMFENFVDLFLGRPNQFSVLSQSTKKTLFWSKPPLENFLSPSAKNEYFKIVQKRILWVGRGRIRDLITSHTSILLGTLYHGTHTFRPSHTFGGSIEQSTSRYDQLSYLHYYQKRQNNTINDVFKREQMVATFICRNQLPD